jgi:ribosomal-protein-serine acetyltransferase
MDTNIHLTDGLILLRPPRPDDVPALNEAVHESLAELHPWMDWATEAYDEAAARRWLEFSQLYWEHSSGFQFAITDAATGQYIGNCGVDGINPKYRFCNLGYWVRTSRTGQGIASRAVRLAARFAFETADLVRAEIVIATGNIASQRAAQKAGAHYEGILLNRMIVRAEVLDAVMYSLTPVDFGLAPSSEAGNPRAVRI